MLKGVKMAVAGAVILAVTGLGSGSGSAATLYLTDGRYINGTVISSDSECVVMDTGSGETAVPRQIISSLVNGSAGSEIAKEMDNIIKEKKNAKEVTVVTANRGECFQSDLPVVVDVITRKDIEKTNAKNVAEAIVKNCGADIISYPEVLSDVSLRGFAPMPGASQRRTMVLVDGRKTLTTNLSTILIDDVERIEILKGPASYLYGSDGMGGAINIITKHSREKVKGMIGYEFRTFMAWKGFLETGGSAFPGTDFDLTLLAFEESHYPVPPANRLWLGNSYTNYNGAYRSGFDVGKNARIDWRADMFLAQDMSFAGDFYGLQAPGKKDMSRLTYDVIYSGKTDTEEHRWQGRFYGGNNLTDYKTAAGFKYNDARTDYMGISAQDRERFSDYHEVVFGSDYNWDRSVTCRYASAGSTSPYVPDYERFNFGVFACDRLRILDERLLLTMGVRFDGYKLMPLDTPYLKNVPGEEYSSSYNPKLAAAYRISDSVQVHSSFGTGFAVPEPYQKTGSFTPAGDTRTVYGNIDLQPERSAGYDAGIALTYPAGSADVTYFYSNLIGGIEKAGNGNTVTFLNSDNQDIYGIEGKASVTLSEIYAGSVMTRVYANFTWLLKDWDASHNRDAYNVAKLKANCGVDLEGKRMDFRFNYRFVGDRKDLYVPASGIPQEMQVGNLHLLDVNFNYKIVEWLQASIRVDNLLNQRVEDKYGYPMPGTVVFGGIALKF